MFILCVLYVYVLYSHDPSPMSNMHNSPSMRHDASVKLMHNEGQTLGYTPQFDTTLRNKGYNVRLGKRR